DPTSTDPGRPSHRVRDRSLKPLVEHHGRVLAPDTTSGTPQAPAPPPAIRGSSVASLPASEYPATPQDVRVGIALAMPRPPQPCRSVAGRARTEGRFEQVEDGGVQACVGPGFPVAPWVIGQVLAEHAEMQGGEQCQTS